MNPDNMSDHLHSKVSAQDVRIGGIEQRLTGVEGAVIDVGKDVKDLVAMMGNTKPTTQFILWIVGGLISVTLLLFVNPLKEADKYHDSKLDKHADVALSIRKELSATKQKALNAEVSAVSLSEAADSKSVMRHDELEKFIRLHESDRLKWQRHHSEHIASLEARMNAVEVCVSSNKAHSISTSNWIEKIDNIGTRNETNR